MTSPSVEIRPEVAIFAAFARLNYRSWYALAEFVDNSLQSYLAAKERFRHGHGKVPPLRVDIQFGGDSIHVSDNAAGIAWPDFPRAFVPASPPPDISGLSEYGLGLKAAASWFARRWSVRTKAYGESVERTITFDVPAITTERLNRLPVTERSVPATEHYTVLSLTDLNVRPRGRTLDKIKKHLASIYRLFLRDGTLELRVDDTLVQYEVPETLEAPYYLDPQGSPRKWKRDFELQLDEAHKIWGWAALLNRASVTNAGFAIFRRNRLIEGSYGEAYRPEVIFRKPNTFTYQRLVGELFVEGFTVSHTKDGIQWADWEEDLLNWLRTELDREPLPLLRQAEGFRVGRPQSRRTLSAAVAETQEVVAQRVPPIVESQLGAPADDSRLRATLPDAQVAAQREVLFQLQHAGERWSVTVELTTDESVEPWLDVSGGERGTERRLLIRVSVAHPFMVRFATPSGSEMQPLVRIAVGLAIAEATARATGVDRAGTIRRNLNELLRNALAAPSEQLDETNDE